MLPIKKLISTKLWIEILNIIEIFIARFFNYTSLHIIITIIITTIITSVINITVLNGQGFFNGQIQIKGIVITNNKTISLMFLSWVLQFPTQVKLYKNKKLDVSSTEGYKNRPNTYS